MARIDFIQTLHNSTRRDYVQRVVGHDKAACAEVASQFGCDYWDGERQYGYGGYRYDGRWRPVAERLVAHYGVKPGDRILDIGCGKGFLLYELTRLIPSVTVCGLDISTYAVSHAKEEVQPFLEVGDCRALPFSDASFDFVLSLGVFHNLPIEGVFRALEEMERVSKKNAGRYFMVESYRSEQEKMNLLYWQLTCHSFHSPESWEWIAKKAGYTGDHGFIFFE